MTVTLYTHPEYQRQVEDWQTLRDLFCGDREVMRGQRYIPKFAIEDKDGDQIAKKMYTQRLSRTFYTNLCEPIVWIWIGWLFSEAINIDSVSRIITPEEQQNIDGQGTSFADLAQEMARILILYGPTYGVIDTPGVETSTLAEDIAMGKRPYAQAIEPMHVPDWRINSVNFSETGEYQQLDYIWRAVKDRTSGREEPQELWYRRSLYFDENNNVISEYFRQPLDTELATNATAKKRFNPHETQTDWEPLEKAELRGLTRLPIVRGGKQSWVQSAAANMERRHQLEASLENILHYQAYKKIFVSGNPLQEDGLILAENAINFLQEGSIVTEISSENPAALDTRIKDITDTIFKQAFNQIRSLPGTSDAVQSDATIREERAPQFAAAKTAITEFETLLNGMVEIWAEAKGTEVREGEKVTISRDFTPEDVDKFINHYNTFRDEINKNAAWRKATLEKAVDDSNFDSETAKEIKEAFETQEANADTTQSAVRDSLIGAIQNANSEGDTGQA